MMKAKEIINAWELRNRRRCLPPEEYVNRMSDLIARELTETGHCHMVVDTVMSIGSAHIRQDVTAIVYAADLLAKQLRQTEAMREESRAELSRTRAEAENILKSAQQEAQQIRMNAQADAERMLAAAGARIEQERRQVMDKANRDAEAIRSKTTEEARQLALDVYYELVDHFTPNAVKDAIEGYRREDSAAYAAAAQARSRAVSAFENTRSAFSDGMTRLQAQMNEQINAMQSSLSRSMMNWREQLYRLETMDLAQCAVNLSTILSGVDKRVSAAAVNGEANTVEALSAVRRNLSRFEKQFRNALTGVGLEVYQPQPGEDFDPARHVLSEAEKDFDPESPLAVAECIHPGVIGSGGMNREAMIRAEVTAKEAPAPKPAEESKPTSKPLFSQIIPGGDPA